MTNKYEKIQKAVEESGWPAYFVRTALVERSRFLSRHFVEYMTQLVINFNLNFTMQLIENNILYFGALRKLNIKFFFLKNQVL